MRPPKTVSEYYKYARKLIAEGKKDEARDAADTAIILIAEQNRVHNSDDHLIDKERVGLWLERFWIGILENNGLLLGDDEPLPKTLEDIIAPVDEIEEIPTETPLKDEDVIIKCDEDNEF